ncbi:MAG: M4 family metallopeptidase, partial [Clostridia bacterium]|nr:M4 family metallopeptidase [Clostridia bacterium]
AAEIENDFDGYNIIIDTSSGEIVREFSTATMAKAEHKYYTTEDPSGNDIVADVTKKGDTYILEDPIRGIKTKQHKKLSPPSYEIDENSKGNVDKNNDGYDDFRLAATAHVYTGQVYDYYADPERFDFILTSGQNNNPAPINVWIPLYNNDFSDFVENASSKETSSGNIIIKFGVGNKDFTGIDGKTHKVNYAESLDVVAHEFTHRVFASKSPELTKQYYGLTGSINEAYSDIMGIFAEAQIKGNGVPDWIIGDMSVEGGKRNIKDPHAKETAASWGDKYAKNPEYKVKYQDPKKSGRDYFIQGSIYENSTIISHAAFLMWDKGIKDISRLEKLWFNSMDGYDASSDFWDVRYNVLAKAQLMGMTEDEIKIISDSFDEVGIVEHSKKMSFFVLRNSNEYTPVEDAAITIITYDVDESAECVKRDETYLGTTDKNGFLGVNLQLFSEMTSMKIEASKEGYSSASKIIEADDTYFILLDKLDNTDPYLENLDLTNSPDVSQIEIKDNMSYVRIDKDKFVCEAPGTYYMYPKDPITDGSHLMYDMPQNLTEALARASVGNYDMTTYECKVKPSEPNLFTVAFSRNEYVILTMDSGSRRFPVNSLHVYKVGDSTISIPANTTVAFRVCRDFSVDTSNAKGLFSLTGEELCTHALYDDSDTELYGKGTFERPVIFTAGQTVVFKTGKKPVKFTMPFRALGIRRDNLSAVGCQ